jgi:hypothetical protein
MPARMGVLRRTTSLGARGWKAAENAGQTGSYLTPHGAPTTKTPITHPPISQRWIEAQPRGNTESSDQEPVEMRRWPL